MNITVEQFQRLIDAVSTSCFDYCLQIGGILAPLIFSYMVSKSVSKKAVQEEAEKNKVLDKRQQKLENIQRSIDDSIRELTNKHNDLVQTQQSVEQNLKELRILSEQSRQANLLTLQSIYKEFFDKYKEFESDVNQCERLRPKFVAEGTWTSEERDEMLYVYNKIKIPKIYFLDKEHIPMLIFEEFERFKPILEKNVSKVTPNNEIWELFDSTYVEFIDAFNEFREKLYYNI
ncbi:TPA: hypothetical protein TXT63_001696 [Streptococcus suis]|nr:hypothetical protein [Streptococcus suis]